MNPTRVILAANLRDLARNPWILAYAATFLLLGEALFWFGGTGPQVVLSLLNIVLLVVPLVAMVFGAIHVYASREFIELLLAQPVSRLRLFGGLYLGLAIPLAAAFVIGTLVPFALHRGAGVGTGTVLALLAAGVALSLVFSALATWIALITDDRLKGVGLALGAWLVTTIVYDGAVLAVTSAFAAWPLEKPMLAMMLFNPVDVARVAVLTQLDASALMGYTGALFTRAFGSTLGLTIVGLALLAWCAAPLALAARRFHTRDF
jgi:Cu-processing system permease protein